MQGGKKKLYVMVVKQFRISRNYRKENDKSGVFNRKKLCQRTNII